MTRPISFEQACAQYVHRYTMDHVPQWAQKPCGNKYYAPQFASDQEWYAATKFPKEKGHPFPNSRRGDCYTTGQTWPLGQWLKRPYRGVHSYQSGDDVAIPPAQRRALEIDRAKDDCAA